MGDVPLENDSWLRGLIVNERSTFSDSKISTIGIWQEGWRCCKRLVKIFIIRKLNMFYICFSDFGSLGNTSHA